MSKSNRAFRATPPIDVATVQAHLDQLVDHAFTTSLSIIRIAQLMHGGPRDFARLGNLPPVIEGGVLEQAIEILAAANPDVTVLANCRLPIDAAFLERVRTTPPHLLGTLRTSGNNPSRHCYQPDLILIDAKKKLAHLLDIKRSLDSYEAHRIGHLRHRMLAAAAGLHALLGRIDMNTVVTNVRVAILNIDATRLDLDKGIWSLAQLDGLIGVSGAAAMINDLRHTFARRVIALFEAARQVLIEDEVRKRVTITLAGDRFAVEARHDSENGDGVTIGFAVLPDDDADTG
jgi:hypothetical protein